jgi:hypothetical protein
MRAAFSILIASAMLAASAVRASEPEIALPEPEQLRPEAATPSPEPVRGALPPELFLPGAVPVEPSPKGDPMATDFQLDCLRERLYRDMRAADPDDALTLAHATIEQFPGTKEAIEAQKIVDSSNDSFSDGSGGCWFPVSAFPHWVASNTRAIIYDESGSLAQIGFDFYAEGQAIRDYPNVFVDKIEPDSVIYRLENEYAAKRYSVRIPSE